MKNKHLVLGTSKTVRERFFVTMKWKIRLPSGGDVDVDGLQCRFCLKEIVGADATRLPDHECTVELKTRE